MRLRRRTRAAGAAASLLLLLAACRAEGSAPPGTTIEPSPPASTPASPAPSETPEPSPTNTPAPPFDANRVSVTLEPWTVVDGSALAITNLGDGSGRLLVATQEGRLHLVASDATIWETPILDIESRVSHGYEQGLLGVAVHPDFPEDPRIFVDYTEVEGDTVVASYAFTDVGGPSLDPGSAVTILTVDQPYANHNGGGIAFGPDGYLYIALGDGGGGGDPHDNGEHLDTLLAKILRIDIDDVDGAAPYGIPGDNPFIGVSGARPEIWLTGLRNPWRFSFDRGTGDLWIGDVGQGGWEEVDVARQGVGGLDFGWNRMEGAHCFDPPTGCSPEGLTLPVTEYGREDGCTIIGGVVYRGSAYPELVGGYLFGDYCSGRLWAIPATTDELIPPVRVGTTGSDLAGFGEDEAGEIYVAQLDGSISRVVATAR